MHSTKRLHEIDVATGIAIILVVIGHIGWKETEWYFTFKSTLYKFHMPFFMFLSGFLLSYTNYNYNDQKKAFIFLRRKLSKFLIPYLFLSILFLLVNLFLKEINTTADLEHGIKSILLYPKSGYSGFMWYLYVLFQYYILFALSYHFSIFQKYPILYLLVSILMILLIPSVQIFEIRNVIKYSLFFSLGFIMQFRYDQVKEILRRTGWVFILLFIGSLFLDLTKTVQFSIFTLGLSSIPAITSIAIYCSKSNILAKFGKLSFTVYLWNSVFIVGVKIVLNTLGLNNFNILFPILITAGLIGPLLLRALRVKYLNNSFLSFIIP